MNNFPFFRLGYPNYYRRYYPDYYSYNTPENTVDNEDNNEETQAIEDDNSEKNNEEQKRTSPTIDDPILEFLGITLYLDDVIILCLLFFLYTEEVQDEFLFIALILLLLS